MLWSGGYPRWLKERIAGPFGHLDNRESERILAAIDRSKLKHIIGAHLSQAEQSPRARARGSRARARLRQAGSALPPQADGLEWRQL